jgi:hypothetical protein
MYNKIEQISQDLRDNYAIEYEEGYIKDPENLVVKLQEKLKKYSCDFDTKRLFEVKKNENHFILNIFQIVRKGNVKKQRKIAEAKCFLTSKNYLTIDEATPRVSAEWHCCRLSESGEPIELWKECELERL